MWLKIFSVVLLLSGCGHVPEKPVVEVGIIDYPRSEIITNKTGPEVKSTEDLKYSNLTEKAQSTGSVRKPLSTYDKSVCFLPDEWTKVQIYMHLMEDYLTKYCSGN
jgi:hypothetical protein